MNKTALVLAWIRFAFMSPWALLTWFACVFLCLVQVADLKKLRFEDVGILTSEWKPWFAAFYPYSLTLGRARIYFPGSQGNSEIRKHESVHTDQVEDLMLLSFLVGLVVLIGTGDIFMGFALWVSGGMWQLPNFLTSLLRYGHLAKWPASGSTGSKFKSFLADLFLNIAYRDSEHERSAYAQTDPGPDGLTWAARRDLNR